ncbi:uncharacterized protein [Palaemon carinicauda]|uniref:uncharacterized protein n=1 Tax=Palaemon carinicauda TaxID=392227 RepID=UPI0035B57672
MWSAWISLLAIFLGRALCRAEDGFSMDIRSAPLFKHQQNSNTNSARGGGIPTLDKTTFNIYPTLVKTNGPDHTDVPLCDEKERTGIQCRTNLPNPDTEARTSSGHRIGIGAVSRQPNQHHVYPPSINYGNAVHIEGNFQGQSRPSSVQPQRNASNTNGQLPQHQSPLVSFNMHSEPHFYPNIPNTFYPSAPSDSNHKSQPQETTEYPSTPSNNNHQNQPQGNIEETIFRINSKLLMNNSDIATLLQTLRQQNQNFHNEKMPSENTNSHGQQTSENANVFPSSLPAQVVLDSLTPNKNAQAASSDMPQPGNLPSTTTQGPILPSTSPDSPLTESQSLAILRGQISAQQKQHLSNLQPTAAATVIPTSNTINIQVPGGSAVTAHHHQSDIAEILTNLQILTILMNQDNKTKAVINGVTQTEHPSISIIKEEKTTNENIPQLRHFSHDMAVHPFHNLHVHPRTKSHGVSSLPFYANPFTFTPNQMSDSELDYSLAEKQIAQIIRSQDSSRFNDQTLSGDRRQNNKGIPNTNPRINSASILNAWPVSHDQNDYNRLLSQLLLKQMLSESKDALITEQYVDMPTSTKSHTPTPHDSSKLQVTPEDSLEIQNDTKLADIRKPTPNTIAPETTLLQSVIPAATSPSQSSQSSSLLTTNASPLAITELGNGITVDNALQDTPSPTSASQLTLQEMQQLEIYHSLLNKFNNRFQNQAEGGSPIPASVPTTPSPQDLILASILQTQVLKKPEPTQPFLGPNDPYVPAIHGDSISSLQSVFAQPPAPPPTVNVPFRNTLLPTSIPFPVRAAGGGGGGGSSYTSIQECLKNTACALFLAGIVATGTTAALAIPVLTPLFGAGFLGKRRRRGLQYFVIKPEETIDFIDNYFRYLSGTKTTELTDEAKCIYDVIKNPNEDSSMTILHSLFEFIFENKNKTLNITTDEIHTNYKEPLVNISSESSKDNSENNPSEMSKANSHISSYSYDQTLNESTSESQETIPLYENPADHSDATESIQAFDTSSISNSVKQSTLNTNSEYQRETSSNVNHQSSQHFLNADWLPNRYAPQRFRPIPSPNVLLHASRIHPNVGYAHNIGTTLHTMIPLEAKLKGYLSSAKDQIETHNLYHPITSLPSYISNSTQSSSLENLLAFSRKLQTDRQYSQVDHQPRNKLGLRTPDGFDQPNPSGVNNAQLSQGIIDFYHNVCHALGEPGIPQSRVITFIAQRCLSFAHAGLIQ